MKKFILTTSMAALLISAVGCQSTDTSVSQGEKYPYERRTEENWASYPRTNPLVQTNNAVAYSPPVTGNFGQQVGATSWQDTRTYVPVDSDTVAKSSVMPPADSSVYSSSESRSESSLSTADQKFLIDATMAQLYEGALGQVAIKKTESMKIRELANKIYIDAAASCADLQRIAKSSNVVVPIELDRAHRDLISKLDATDKTSFDMEFLRMEAAAHRDSIALYETHSTTGKFEASRNLAKSALPTMQSHLQQVEAPFNTASEK